MAIISLLLFSGLDLMQRTWRSIDSELREDDNLRSGYLFIRHTLQQLQPLTEVGPEGKRLAFSGDQQRLQLISPLASGTALGGLSRLAIYYDSKERRLSLHRWLHHPEVTPQLPVANAAIAPQIYSHHTLLTEVDAVTFTYYGTLFGTKVAHWYSDWQNIRLPQLIKLEVVVAGEVMPPMVMTLPSRPRTGFSVMGTGYDQ
ncbi:MAG: hypothetical protein HQL49_03920 [Gammaproteobacteria bacterium]|nr:hypothetical protein [Gammaproteobacteria bacterium]